MRSLVTSALFDALPAAGYATLRFNFRGVEGSEGTWDDGTGEQHDVVAAIDALGAELMSGVPLAVVGWSFGGDMALSVADSRVAGWCAIAPPLRFSDGASVAYDPRPKHLVLAEHDEVRAPQEIVDAVAPWTATTVEVVGGASHFFVGRTDRVVDAVDGFCARLRSAG
jgi:alpha/beta superfamily hydrolase